MNVVTIFIFQFNIFFIFLFGNDFVIAIEIKLDF